MEWITFLNLLYPQGYHRTTTGHNIPITGTANRCSSTITQLTTFGDSNFLHHGFADALKSLYHSNADVKVIGTRHGEKLYETLVTREEMSKAEDMGDYYRIPCDTRDLNYDKFFVEGSEEVSKIEDYHSHNTRRLDVEGMKELLLKLNFIREDLGLEK